MTTPNYIPSFIPKDVADTQYERLWNTLDWERRSDAPRREYWMNDYGLPYTYGRGAGVRSYDCQPWDEFVQETMHRINREFGYSLNCCFMNGYENSRDWLGWHADDSIEMDDDQPVISLSFGAERNIETRNNDTGEIQKQLLGHSSLFIMPPHFQDSHQHRVPKVGYDVGPRISLTYRRMIDGIA